MANNYTDGCAFLPLEDIPEIDKVLKAWRILNERDSPESHPLPFNINKSGGLELGCSYGRDGAVDGIYISTRDGWLNEELFHRFFALMFKNGWITASCVSIECAIYCECSWRTVSLSRPKQVRPTQRIGGRCCRLPRRQAGRMNHSTLLAFGYTYMPLGGTDSTPYDDSIAGPYYGLVNAPSFEDFQARTCDLANVTLVSVHHISADDVFTLTDIVWNSKTDSTPYDDSIARQSFECQGLLR
ncbi:MAG: hypothetical protein VKI63_04275 [Cyanobium sp.]|nr:hypothetical protein [Cyanobium sp.]